MKKLLATLMIMTSLPTMAMNVFTCEPEWGSLVSEIAKDKASVYVATNASQDAHYIQAKPSLIANIRKADMVVCTGAELEVGWLPVVLKKAGSASIQEHGANLIYGADYVNTLEKPARIDRADGDVHPEGNPHIHLNPNNMIKIGEVVANKLADIDSENAEFYKQNYSEFKKRMTTKIKEWETKAKPLANQNVITNHRNMSYLFDWLKIKTAGTLEPKPGIPATSKHLNSLIETVKRQKVSFVAHTPFEKDKPANWLSEQTGIKVVKLPYTVGGDVKDLFQLYEESITLMLKAKEK